MDPGAKVLEGRCEGEELVLIVVEEYVCCFRRIRIGVFKHLFSFVDGFPALTFSGLVRLEEGGRARGWRNRLVESIFLLVRSVSSLNEIIVFLTTNVG